MFHHLYQSWVRFWFTPESPTNLAICRIMFFGAIFLYYLPQDFSLWGTVDSIFWNPAVFFRLFQLPVLPTETLALMQAAWKVALLLSCIGVLTRFNIAVSFLLGFYLLGMPQNMGKIHHVDALVIFVFGILMLSRCADAFSVDAYLKKHNPQPSGEYRWPIRMIWLTMALIFFASGVAKLRNSGFDWIFSENMAVILLKQQYPTSEPDPLVSWGVLIAQFPLLYQMLAAMTILLEAGYPLTLVSRRARWLFVPGMLLVQIGIRVVMGPSFIPFMICNLFWIPWDRLHVPVPVPVRQPEIDRVH